MSSRAAAEGAHRGLCYGRASEILRLRFAPLRMTRGAHPYRHPELVEGSHCRALPNVECKM